MVKFNEHFRNWSLQSSVLYKIQTRNILERNEFHVIVLSDRYNALEYVLE